MTTVAELFQAVRSAANGSDAIVEVDPVAVEGVYAVPVQVVKIPLPIGAASETTLTSLLTAVQTVGLGGGGGGSGSGVQFADGAARGTATGTLAMGEDGTNVQALSCDSSGRLNVNLAGSVSLPTGAATEATLGARLAEATFTARIPVLGQALMAASKPVVIASNQSAIPVTSAGPTTGTSASVASSTSAVTLRALNANRRGLTAFNDSTSTLYVLLGTGVSASVFTVRMAAGGYYEVPFDYTGVVEGVWAVANGFARMTELT